MTLKAIFLDFRGVLIDDRAVQTEAMKALFLDQNLLLMPQEYQTVIQEQDDRQCLQTLLEHRGRLLGLDYLHKLLQKRFEITQSIANKKSPSQLAEELLPNISPQTTTVFFEPRLDPASLLLPGVKDFLFRARSLSLAIVLITSSIYTEVNFVLEQEKIKPYFNLILTGENLSSIPIKPQAYLEAIQRLNTSDLDLNLTPQHCLAIEPLYSGLAAARTLVLLGLNSLTIER